MGEEEKHPVNQSRMDQSSRKEPPGAGSHSRMRGRVVNFLNMETCPGEGNNLLRDGLMDIQQHGDQT